MLIQLLTVCPSLPVSACRVIGVLLGWRLIRVMLFGSILRGWLHAPLDTVALNPAPPGGDMPMQQYRQGAVGMSDSAVWYRMCHAGTGARAAQN